MRRRRRYRYRRRSDRERPVFVPFIYGLAARLGQIPLSEMTSDASYYTHSLEDAYELFKYDGIVNTFDSTLEAEIFGCELEWPEDYQAPRVTDCSHAKLLNRLFLQQISKKSFYLYPPKLQLIFPRFWIAGDPGYGGTRFMKQAGRL